MGNAGHGLARAGLRQGDVATTEQLFHQACSLQPGRVTSAAGIWNPTGKVQAVLTEETSEQPAEAGGMFLWRVRAARLRKSTPFGARRSVGGRSVGGHAVFPCAPGGEGGSRACLHLWTPRPGLRRVPFC